jgi:hypothetical protein
MIPLQDTPHQEMIPLRETAESYQRSSELQFAIDFPLGITWGIETKFGIIAPPTLPINSGINQGMQFFPKRLRDQRRGEIELDNSYVFWRAAGYPEDYIFM